MFRKMRRWKQQLSLEACIEVLKKEPRGVLSMMGEDGYPYGIPMNHWYCEADGKLYFHGAKEGHKIDALRACDKVSYCVHDQGYRKEGEWSLNIQSVVVFGTIKPVEDEQKAVEICRSLSAKFTDDPAYVEYELESGKNRLLCLELTPDHMTGKLVNES